MVYKKGMINLQTAGYDGTHMVPQVIYKPHYTNGVRNGVFILLLWTPVAHTDIFLNIY